MDWPSADVLLGLFGLAVAALSGPIQRAMLWYTKDSPLQFFYRGKWARRGYLLFGLSLAAFAFAIVVSGNCLLSCATGDLQHQ
jgi:hypothetical protein